MPELEEGNLWVRGTFPLNITLEGSPKGSPERGRSWRRIPEVETVVNADRPARRRNRSDGYYNGEFFVPLRPEKDSGPAVVEQTGWRRWVYGRQTAAHQDGTRRCHERRDDRARSPGVDWNFSQNIRDNVMEAMSGVKGDNSVKIFGPDLEELDRLADEVRNRLRKVRGIDDVGVFSIKGQTNLDFRVDLEKCKKWGVSAADVNNVIQTALGGKALSTHDRGGEVLRHHRCAGRERRRGSETSILDIPVDMTNNQVVAAQRPGADAELRRATANATPATDGSVADTTNPLTSTPRLRLRDLVSPVGKAGRARPQRQFRARRRLDDLPGAGQAT